MAGLRAMASSLRCGCVSRYFTWGQTSARLVLLRHFRPPEKRDRDTAKGTKHKATVLRRTDATGLAGVAAHRSTEEWRATCRSVGCGRSPPGPAPYSGVAVERHSHQNDLPDRDWCVRGSHGPAVSFGKQLAQGVHGGSRGGHCVGPTQVSPARALPRTFQVTPGGGGLRCCMSSSGQLIWQSFHTSRWRPW